MRVLNAVLLLIVAAVLLACGTAPWIFNALIYLGRSVEAWEALRDLEFEEVIARLVLIYLVLGFVPAIRWGGARTLSAVGLARGTDWKGEVWREWLLGVGSIVGLYMIALLLGACVWEPDGWGRVAGRLPGYLVGGLIIGLVEEVFFRGMLFGYLRKVIHWLPAALVVSLFFAFVHFLRPESPSGIVCGEWHTGFSLLPHTFYITARLDHYIPFALTLFMMSMVLCFSYQREGRLYRIIGLHAGWVLALQLGRMLFARNLEVWGFLFGAADNLARSWAALVMLLILWIWVVFRAPSAN